MNPKHLRIRVDRESGDLWLTEERYQKPPRKIANMTAHILLAMTAELTSVDESTSLTRDVRFSDGTAIRVSVSLIEENENDDSPAASADPAWSRETSERPHLQHMGVDEGVSGVGAGPAALPGPVGVRDGVPPAAGLGD